MGLFSRHHKEEAIATVCAHRALDPRWDAIEDVGIKDRIDHVVCRDCGRKFATEAADEPP